jgi:glycosyltransferase involved in cell wall biosynthesis
MKKRILHIIVKTGYDGVTSYTTRLIKYLPQYNHHILSCYKGSAITEVEGMNVNCEHLINDDCINNISLLKKYLKSIIFFSMNRFDIIHYHQGGIGILLLAWFFKKKAMIIHHLHSGNLIGDNRKQAISFLHLLLLKFISRYTYQIAVADHVFNEYKSKVGNIVNLTLIKNSTPFKFEKKKEVMSAVGYIGRFTKEKGFPVFLNLASQLKIDKPKLTIYAKGDTFNPDKSNIELIPPSFSINSFYIGIDLLIYTSSAPESLPLVLLEAISLDVAVIAYPLKGVVEILGDNYPLYINGPKDVISKIEYYYSDKFDRQKLSDIHKKKSNIFNFDEMVGKINSLYTSLLFKH